MKSMHCRNITGMVLCAVFFATMLFFPAWGFCQQSVVERTYQPAQWIDYLVGMGNWVPLPIPDSKYKPGSIIQVTWQGPRRFISYIGNLKDTFPEGAFQKPEPSKMAPIKVSTSKEFSSEALLQIFGFKPGPSFGMVKKVDLDITDYGAPALDLNYFETWLAMPENKNNFKPQNLEILRENDIFVISEALIVSKATYTLSDKNDVKINLDIPDVIKTYITGNVKLNYGSTNEGKLEIKEPVVFAIRYAVRLGPSPTRTGRWQILKDPKTGKQVTADEQIKKLSLEGAEMLDGVQKDKPVK